MQSEDMQTQSVGSEDGNRVPDKQGGLFFGDAAFEQSNSAFNLKRGSNVGSRIFSLSACPTPVVGV